MNRANRKKKKLSNLKLLDNAGIKYRLNPKCAWHYHIGSGEDRVDFWPTTGKYLVLNTGKYSVGFDKLIAHVKESRLETANIRPAKQSLNRRFSKVSTDAKHRQRKIMDHFGMNFS